METNGGSVQCAGGSLGQHRHICAFFSSVEEEHRVLCSFVKDGFERGDKACHLVNPDLWEGHLRWLAESGIDPVRDRVAIAPVPGARLCTWPWKTLPGRTSATMVAGWPGCICASWSSLKLASTHRPRAGMTLSR